LIGGSSAPHLDNNTKSLMDEAVAGLDVVFLVVGMGGATGTSLAPQIAEVLREKQITTFAAALTPFDFDGQPRAEITRNGLDELCRLTTATFPVPPALRDQWFQPRRAHTVEQLYRSIAIPLCETGFIGRFDPADFRQILAGDGRAAMGYGSAQGKNSATTATLQAIAHPLLGLDRLRSASSVLVLVEISGTSFHMRDAIKIPVAIRNALTEHYDGHLLFGAFRTASMADDFRVTILACRNEAEAPLLKPTNLASDQRYTS
jgi:cell division protein FtsZ